MTGSCSSARVIGIMEAAEFRYEETLLKEHKELIESDAIRKAAEVNKWLR